MLTAEQQFLPPTDQFISLHRENIRDDANKLPDIAYAVINHLSRPYHALNYFIDRQQGYESQHTNWNNKNYLRKFFDLCQQGLAQNADAHQVFHVAFSNLLRRDWTTLLDELVLWKTPLYDDYSKFGLPNGYQEPMVDLGQHFITDRQRKGGTTHRAEVEQTNMQHLTQWMEDPTVKAGTKLLWLSPPGSKADGYLGKGSDKPTKANVYSKSENNGATIFQQYNLWERDVRLFKLQQEFLQAGNLLTASNQPTRSLEETIISRLVQLPETISLPEIETKLYQNEQTWKRSRADFPILDEEAFFAFRDRTFAAYLSQVENVFTAAVAHQELLGVAYWHSSELVSDLRALDLLFFTCIEATLKWVEDYDARETKEESKSPPLTERENLRYLHEKLELQGIALGGGTLSSKQIQRLRALNVAFSVSNRLFSLSQCGLLSPVSIIMSAGRSLSGSLELGGVVEGLSLSSKSELLQDLEGYVRLDLPGAKKVWMVPASYLEEPGCHVVMDGPHQGEVMGPCNILLSDPREKLALTEEDYLALTAELQKNIAEEELEAAIAAAPLSDTDKARARELVEKLTRHIFKVSLTSLIAGVTELRNESSAFLSHQALMILTESHNPLVLLESLVMHLIQAEQNGGDSSLRPYAKAV